MPGRDHTGCRGEGPMLERLAGRLDNPEPELAALGARLDSLGAK